MKLQPSKNPPERKPRDGEGACFRTFGTGCLQSRILWFLLGAVLCPFIGNHDVAYAQQARMVINGTIRSDRRLPPTTRIRVLHEDSSVDRTVQFYDPQGYKFGIRLSSHDGYLENEKILFRVVVTAQDSFVARFVGSPLVFRGTNESLPSPITKVELFRNTQPTVYRALGDTTIREAQHLIYRLVAIDKDADTVHYAMENAPAGARIDPITGLFSWTPSYDQAGHYKIRFLISDGFETDNSHASEVTIRNVDRPPGFLSAVPDTTTREAATLRFLLHAFDPDQDTLTYRLVFGPTGLKVDSPTGLIDWKPTYDQAGSYQVRFLVTDGLLTDTSTVGQITVLNTDRPPAFTSVLSDTTIKEDQELHYQFAARDPDGDSVWFRLRNGPEGSDLDSLGFLTWRPTFMQSGDYRFAVIAHDRQMSVDSIVQVRVLNVDRPPGSFRLHHPFEYDTIRLVLSTAVRFAWSRSNDPDIGDTLRYALRIWGGKLDTTIRNLTDTTVQVNIKPLLRPLSMYHWNVLVNDGMLRVASPETFAFRTSEGITGSVELISEIPKTYDLEQSLPDPFNPLTTIRYALPERSYVKLTIYNMLGESLLVLVSGDKDAGVYDVTFDASDFTSGAYMFRMDAHPLSGNQTKDFVNTKKMFIVR